MTAESVALRWANMLLPWIAANQRRVRPIESDWTRSAGQVTRRVGLIYPAAGQIDFFFSLSRGFTPCRHLRPSSGREHTIV